MPVHELRIVKFILYRYRFGYTRTGTPFGSVDCGPPRDVAKIRECTLITRRRLRRSNVETAITRNLRASYNFEYASASTSTSINANIIHVLVRVSIRKPVRRSCRGAAGIRHRPSYFRFDRLVVQKMTSTYGTSIRR